MRAEVLLDEDHARSTRVRPRRTLADRPGDGQPERTREFALGEAEAQQGMAEMSEKFREQGGEIYLLAPGKVTTNSVP